MNIANKLTVSRLVMAPLFFIAFHLPQWLGPSLQDSSTILIIVLWLLTELSDLLDGQIARRRGMITDLGKVMDPFADTISRMTYFVCFVSASMMPIWAFILIMWRELSILFVRALSSWTADSALSGIVQQVLTPLFGLAAIASVASFLTYVRAIVKSGALSSMSR